MLSRCAYAASPDADVDFSFRVHPGLLGSRREAGGVLVDLVTPIFRALMQLGLQAVNLGLS